MNDRLFKTLGLLTLLWLTGCRVTFAPPSPTEAPTPLPSPTPTPVWFPPTAQPTSFPTPQLQPTTDMRPGIGDLLLEDDFSDAALWTTGGERDAVVIVSNNTVHLTLNLGRNYLFSTRAQPVLGNFYTEITAEPSLCRGGDEYGLLLRVQNGDHYRFALSCDGSAKVDRYLGGSLTRHAGWASNRIIPSLAPSSVRLGVWARGSQMHFFVNDMYFFSVSDTQLYQGTLGVFVHTSGEGDVSVSFSDLRVWALE
ncbi:MAG: hypothetical protein KIS80_00150 [Anaerolineales bacterium]|nr:hypothetical protein [Anaerolineales bacterium]